VVYGVRVFEGDEVEPAAAAGTAGGGADFAADGLELMAGFLVLLCRKGSAPDSEECQSWNSYKGVECQVSLPCSVSFDYAYYFFNLERVDAKT